MKANKTIRRRILCGATAAVLSAVMLVSVSCTRNEVNDPKETTAGTTAGMTGTTGGTVKPNAPESTPSGTTDDKPGDNKPGMTTPGTGKPLDPDAGTVAPNPAPGDPPAGTGEGKGMRSRFMH